MPISPHPRRNTRPALLLAASFAGGITLASACPWPGILGYSIGAGFVGAAVLLSLIRESSGTPVGKPIVWTIALFLLCLLLGSIHYHSHRRISETHLLFTVRAAASSDAEPVAAITGRIATFPALSDRYSRFILSADTVETQSSARMTKGYVHITCWKPYDLERNPFRSLAYGTRVRIHGTPAEVRPPGNPADFDYRSYLARRDVHLTMSVSNISDIQQLETSRDLSARILTPVRSYVRNAVESTIRTPEARAILMALLLGDRSQIDAAVKDQFRRTGLMHLLAISGLHVMMIGLVFYSLLLPLLKRLSFSWKLMEWTRSVVTAGILLVYCLITGAPASVVRALVMTVIVLGGVLAQRTYQPLNALGAAALVLLGLDPDQLFDVGFQLSFAAVAGILTITPAINKMMPRRIRQNKLTRPLLSTSIVSAAATLATMPVTLYHFGQVAFGGLVLNTIAIPVTVVVLCGAVAILLLFGSIPPAAHLVGSSTDRTINLLLGIADIGNDIFSWALVQRSVQSPLLVLAIIAAVLTVARWHSPRPRWILLCACLTLLTAFTWLDILSNRVQELDLIFFDVGQGDAALIQLPNDRAVLIDGGNRSSFTDEGTRTILPHLQQHGIDRLAAIIISHGHRDHMGGIPSVLRRVSTGRIIYNGRNVVSDVFTEMVRVADSLGVPLEQVSTGDTLQFDPRVRVSVLAPFTTPAADADANEASVVIRLQYGEIVALFTGDIEGHSEERLVRFLPRFLATDIIKVAHHGSETSSTQGFVSAASALPRDHLLAIICAGRDNNFDHPHPRILERWRSADADNHLTANGAGWLRTVGYQLQSVPWR